MDTTKPQPPATVPDVNDERAPYEPPAVISMETFETLALGCGKHDASGGSACHPPNNKS
jgi:hypothetical protein